MAEQCRATRGVEPVFLQGQIGDVNPGDGTKPGGEPEPTAAATWKGLDAAIGAARETPIDRLQSFRSPPDLPLDLDRSRAWLSQ